MSRTVLVTGGTGFLGRAVVGAFESAGWTAIGTGFTRASPPKTLKVDLTVPEEVEKVFDEVKPSVVVHCAADRSPDSCSANPAAAKAINVTATSTLADLATSRSILLIYISTDYVFPGVPGEAPYSASSPPRPTNIYGELKLEGEKVALAAAEHNGSPGSVVTLRVPVLYGPVEPVGNNKESAINILLDVVWKASQPPSASTEGAQASAISMDDWAIRYPTSVEDVGRVCKDIAVKYLSPPPPKSSTEPTVLPKILQFSSEDRYTKYQICQLLATEVLGIPIDEDRMKPNRQGNEPGATVQRPYDTHLSTEELKALGIDVRTMDFVAWWRRYCRAYRK